MPAPAKASRPAPPLHLVPSGELEQIVPYNIPAEEAVLCSLLLDSQAILDIVSFLAPADFFREKNRWVYEAVLRLHERREAIDFLTVISEMRAQGTLTEAGGEAFLAGLLSLVATSTHIIHYARLVEADAIRRRLLEAAQEIARFAHDKTDDVQAVLGKAGAALVGVTRKTESDLMPVSAAVSAVAAQMENGVAPGLTTGLRDLDQLTNGLRPTELIVIGARPAMGKTSLILNMVETLARRGHRVALVSLEMSGEEVTRRLIAQLTGVDLARLIRNELTEDEIGDVYRAMAVINEWRIDYMVGGSLTVNDAIARITRQHTRTPYDIVFVDYIQLMVKGAVNRVAEIGQVTRGLKGLAMDLRIPVVAISSLSRAVEGRADRRPALSDLRESGDIESDANVVGFMYREEYYNKDTVKKNITEIEVAKNRHGPTGLVEVYFDKTATRFRDLARV